MRHSRPPCVCITTTSATIRPTSRLWTAQPVSRSTFPPCRKWARNRPPLNKQYPNDRIYPALSSDRAGFLFNIVIFILLMFGSIILSRCIFFRSKKSPYFYPAMVSAPDPWPRNEKGMPCKSATVPAAVNSFLRKEKCCPILYNHWPSGLGRCRAGVSQKTCHCIIRRFDACGERAGSADIFSRLFCTDAIQWLLVRFSRHRLFFCLDF